MGQSFIYETAPWGKTDQPGFLNQCLQYKTSLLPGQLLDRCMAIEAFMKRERIIKWGPRTIDIDILFYNQDIVNTPLLIIPHPAIAERRFVLIPLAELSPTLLHPVYLKTITELLKECKDPLEVTLYNAKQSY